MSSIKEVIKFFKYFLLFLNLVCKIYINLFLSFYSISK